MKEIAVCEAGIQSLLRACPAIPTGTTIESDPLGPQAPRLSIGYHMVFAHDVIGPGGTIYMDSALYQVVAVCRDAVNIGAAGLIPLAEGIHQALHGAKYSDANGAILSCLRERVINAPVKDESGQRLWLLGGWYKIAVQAAS